MTNFKIVGQGDVFVVIPVTPKGDAFLTLCITYGDSFIFSDRSSAEVKVQELDTMLKDCIIDVKSDMEEY